MKLPKPTGKRVLGEVLPEETTTSGIIMASANLDKYRCRVLAIGPDVKFVKVGDIVRYNHNEAISHQVNGKDCVFVKEKRNGITFIM